MGLGGAHDPKTGDRDLTEGKAVGYDIPDCTEFGTNPSVFGKRF